MTYPAIILKPLLAYMEMPANTGRLIELETHFYMLTWLFVLIVFIKTYVLGGLIKCFIEKFL